MMAKTIVGLQDGLHMQTLNMPNSLWIAENRPDGQMSQQCWNVDVLVQVVQELVSGTGAGKWLLGLCSMRVDMTGDSLLFLSKERK